MTSSYKMAFSNSCISSPTNAFIKQVVRLHEARERKETGLFILEGTRAIRTALTTLTLEKIYCTEKTLFAARTMVEQKDLICVSEPLMKKISTATTPCGVLALFQIPETPPAEKLSPGLVLAQINDPGNMGTLIRTAAACGITSVVIVGGVDPWSPKVVQSSAGALALIDIFEWDWPTLIASKRDLQLAALVVEGGKPLSSIDISKSLIVVGNEARGIPEEWLQDCEQLITLPMPGGTESLNAAIAGSIALYNAFVKP